jgi:tellurite resistance protein
MADDSLHERGKELEEAFFRKMNAKLTENLQSETKKKLDKEAIAKLTGISSDAVLDRLIELKIGPSTLAAFGLLPVLEVAWADGKIGAKEKRAVLDAAKQTGVTPASVDMIGHWLEDKPPKVLFEAWRTYIGAMVEHLAPEDRVLMRDEVLGRARAVAEASGGFLGLGHKVSKAEKAVLEKISKAFSG